MTIFEYLIIAFSLLFTITALRLIEGVPFVIKQDKRYGVHLIFIVTTMLGVIFIFWNYWSLRDMNWTLPKFILALIIPSLYYFLAILLVPKSIGDIDSWRDYYYTIRVRYFTTLLIWFVLANLSARVLLEISFWHPARQGQLVGIVLCILGITSENPKVQWLLAVVFLVQMLLMITIIGANPEWLNDRTNIPLP